MNPLDTARNHRILVIDDNPAIHQDFRKILGAGSAGSGDLEQISHELFGESLDRVEGLEFDLESAFQGQEGLERVKQAVASARPYAMAFVDVRMPPGWDGVETIEKLWEVYPDLQVVICTAYSDYAWDDLIAKVGRSDRLLILKKPFDNVEVLQLANALTEKWRLLQCARLRIDGLEQAVAARTQQLSRSEERFKKICNFSPFGIIETDHAGRCSYTNPRWNELSGRTAEQNAGLGWTEAIHPDEREATLAAWGAAADAGRECSNELKLMTSEAEVRWAKMVTSPIFSPGGALLGYVSTVEDITARKCIEGERNAIEVQLRHAQKLEAIGQLAAGIAHEINTPTQYIGDNTRFICDAFGELNILVAQYEKLFKACNEQNLSAELVREVAKARQVADLEYLTTEVPKAIQQSLEGVERVAKIVRAMKEFSHPGTAQKSAIDLNQAIESTITVARNEWKYVAEVVTQFDPALPSVPGLAGELNQVVLNLIINATQAIAEVVGDGTKGKGTITVSTSRRGEWAEIQVKDTGPGIPEKIRSRIFEPFFTTKGVGKGTGQGLAISRSVVVDKHGGTISFTSEVGQGTVFIIRLPLNPETSETAKSS
jgi:two-component system, NtrC family, sensor kinase